MEEHHGQSRIRASRGNRPTLDGNEVGGGPGQLLKTIGRGVPRGGWGRWGVKQCHQLPNAGAGRGGRAKSDSTEDGKPSRKRQLEL